ncbi:MAG: methyltransferase domain-containing protein [Lachnospiraceae bacterium]|jgi:SAM-dependent methyltransferase|nr:methyltransferase domain-containing protein [Lachnospiraceae bacterium]
MVMYRSCPICGNKKGEKLKNISMYRLGENNPLPLSYNVVCCSSCGFAYADVHATQKEYDQYYRECNMYAENAALKVADLEREEEFIQVCKVFGDKIERDANIIDIGCGSGDFLGYLQKKGFSNLCGMDPSWDSVEKLRERGVRGVCNGVFEPVAQEEKNKYDLIISIGVIEHIYDLRNYLSQILQYMRRDKKSYFLCECPAVEGFEKYIHPVPDYFNHEHINYFSKGSLDNLFNAFGLYRVNEEVYVDIGKGESRGQLLIALYEMKDQKGEIKYDNTSMEPIKNYFKEVSAREKELEGKVEDLLSTSKKLLIWGSGAYAMQLIKKYPELMEKADCFIDNNSAKQGIKIGEKMVYGPEYIQNQEEMIIAICSMMNAHDIEKQIKGSIPNCSIVIL